MSCNVNSVLATFYECIPQTDPPGTTFFRMREVKILKVFTDFKINVQL